MVYIILTSKGLKELLPTLACPQSLWLNSDVADKDCVSNLRNKGWNVTTWTSRVDPTSETEVCNAIGTVQMHHQDEVIWVEQTL